MTVFEKIAAREIPAQIILETDDVVAFHDAHPQAPVHLLVIPRKCIPRLEESEDSDGALLGQLLLGARDAARLAGLAKGGYRVVINNGRDAGESVPHLHLHVLGGRALTWPPG
jgi:histidine triad (HIT) family protein